MVKKRKKQNIAIAAIAIILLGVVIGYSYSADQEKLRGFTFGNELQAIQDELKEHQTNFNSRVTALDEGDYTKEALINYSEKHFANLEKLLQRYEILDPPDSFASSVELFRLSTESQLESDRQLILWIQNGDDSYKIRSDSLLQEAVDYELAALEKFNAAKRGENP